MTYIGPMASFNQEKKNHPADIKIFRDIVDISAEEWLEYMENQKNWTKDDWKLHIQYVDALGSKRMHGYCK
ncbi:MAG: hypothetical protein ABIF85_02155 [Nanoarchaeota archaeon]|nr:hypothetical protein [Nanoarchaeota archaeon]MBU4451556.1 hypothetical protein [Nanoarchaeota archaeon]MCG2724487.1 hypothetical protein [archaeon]